MKGHRSELAMASQSAALVADRSWIGNAEVELKDAIGCRFDFWFQDVDGWKRMREQQDDAPTAVVADPPTEFVTSLLDEAIDANGEPLLANHRDGRQLLVMAICRDHDVDVVVTANVSTSEPELLLRLAQRVGRDLHRRDTFRRLSDENEAFAQQVTEDFEELTFLRQMGEHLEVSDISKDVLGHSETILPLLLPTLKAEFVAFVLASQGVQPSNVEIGQVISCRGTNDFGADACRKLVQRYRRHAANQPVVKNGICGIPDGDDFPGITALVLVQVAKDVQLYGWLLALNRAPGYGYDGQRVSWLDSDLEFGTAEAALLVTAASVLAAQARNCELFREKEQLLTNVVLTLVSTIEAKDPYTCGHSERVAAFARRLAERLGLNEPACDRIYLAGLLHDVGKIGVSDATLRKPSRLSDDEFEEIKRHPDSGWAILHELHQLAHILPGVLYHHERYDGTGYPDGLTGSEIPLDGRILAIADAYDAMTSDRSYRNSLSQDKAESILRDGAGTHWDAILIDVFLKAMPNMIQIRQNYTKRNQATRRRQSVKGELE